MVPSSCVRGRRWSRAWPPPVPAIPTTSRGVLDTGELRTECRIHPDAQGISGMSEEVESGMAVEEAAGHGGGQRARGGERACH